jgi:F0F1-type ATP synthase assembly protein I
MAREKKHEYTSRITKKKMLKSRISDRWIPAGVLGGLGLGMLLFGFSYNPFAIPGGVLLGLGFGFAMSIVFRREEREG